MVATKPSLEGGDAPRQGHASHVFSGWGDFLNHLRLAHGLEPLNDDGETWLIHDSPNADAAGPPAPTNP